MISLAEVGTSTASPAFHVGVSVNCPDPNCTREPPHPPEKPGCTDPAATNYDKDATSDNGSCRYHVPNVSGFHANGSQAEVTLTWTNPTYQYFNSVVIVKSRTGMPLSPTDGQVIYSGAGEAFTDTNIAVDNTYYYAAFVHSSQGDYSSGAVTSITIKSEEKEKPAEEKPGAPGGGTGGGSQFVSTSSPFEAFPEAKVVDMPPALFEQVEGMNFRVIQDGEMVKKIFQNGTVRVRGTKNITISIPYEMVPEVLKTIGATIFDPRDPNRTFSFILRLNSSHTAYEATISPLPNGDYSILFYIIDYKNQTIQKIKGNMLVSDSALLPDSVVAQVVDRVVAPVAIGGGLAVAIAQLLSSIASLSSFSDVYLLIIRAFGALVGLMGIRRRHKPWGTVFDAVTKRPIDPAYVSVLSGDKEVSTAITDIDGRYGFYLPAGQYMIKAGKTHYKFPSEMLRGKASDELYGNLYFGEPFVTTGEEVIDKNIPLDPVDFDWNEFVKGQTEYFKISSKKEMRKITTLNYFYWGGLIMAAAYMLFRPGYVNLLMVSLYGAIYLFERGFKLKHKTVTVLRNGQPLPFAIIRVFLPDSNQQVKSVVADALGRFFVLVRPEKYYLTVEEKQSDGSYVKVFQTDPMMLDTGILNEGLTI